MHLVALLTALLEQLTGLSEYLNPEKWRGLALSRK